MSINLTATNQSLQLVTTTAVQTQIVASGRDSLTGAQTPVSQETNVAAAATTAIAGAPGASAQRMIDDIEISVVGSGVQGINVQKLVAAATFSLINILLNTNERAHYTNDMGWRVFDVLGREKGNTVGFALIKAPFFDGTSGGPKTYTPSTNCTALLIELWGAGGAGGGAAATGGAIGSGGSCGGYVRKFFIGVPSSFVYTLGAGGTGVSGAAGNNGGATTVGPINGTTLTASPGTGGLTIAGAATVTDTGAPAAVSGTGGDENITTPSGASGCRFSATQGFGGEGGDSPMGNNGARSAKQAAGNAASGNNAGGGGAFTNTTAALAGGNGAPACIRVWEFTG